MRSRYAATRACALLGPLALATAAGCGSDDDDTTPNTGGTANAGSGGQSGSGGSSGTGGGSAGTGGGSAGTGGGSACSAQGDSCANGETCCDGSTCCSGVPVPEGQEFCGATCPISDVHAKRDFASVDPDAVLEKLSRLPIATWRYTTEPPGERHIGPMAQDFMALFDVGSSDRTILQVDADGVTFAAIQALNARLERLEQENLRLKRQLERLAPRTARP